MISFSEIRNHEFQTHFTISTGLKGHVKNGDTRIGTSGTWFQPFSSVSDMPSSARALIPDFDSIPFL